MGRTQDELAMDKVIGAASISESSDFIESCESSYDQMPGKEFTGGVELLIGQWQKLALARVFLS